jgi:hypothetical protein
MRPHIVRVNNPLVGMFSWSPFIKGTQVFFVLSLQFLSVDSKETTNGMTIGSAVID